MKSIRDTSPVIATYLAELDAATAHLPADEQFDIRDSIEAHIADMVGGREHVDADTARHIIGHLGDHPGREHAVDDGRGPHDPPHADRGHRPVESGGPSPGDI